MLPYVWKHVSVCTVILGPIWIEGEEGGVEGSRVELAEK